MTDLICIGAIAGAYGVKGGVRLKSFTAIPEDIGQYSPLVSEDGQRLFDLTLGRPIKNGFSARIAGITTKEAADALRGTRLFLERARLPSLPDDEYYHTDLIGLSVYDTGGVLLGEVTAIHNHGAADLLEIRPQGGSRTELLPFTLVNVPTVDLAARRIVADPPDGIFDSE